MASSLAWHVVGIDQTSSQKKVILHQFRHYHFTLGYWLALALLLPLGVRVSLLSVEFLLLGIILGGLVERLGLNDCSALEAERQVD
jgi:hypothetical protein